MQNQLGFTENNDVVLFSSKFFDSQDSVPSLLQVKK
jgi:hypothetical protein